MLIGGATQTVLDTQGVLGISAAVAAITHTVCVVELGIAYMMEAGNG